MATTNTAVLELADLPDEDWGNRLLRARKLSGLTLQQAAWIVTRFTPTTSSTVLRLESNSVIPHDARRRALAYFVALAYGRKPEAFGLSIEDLPSGISAEQAAETIRTARDQVVDPSVCIPEAA